MDHHTHRMICVQLRAVHQDPMRTLIQFWDLHGEPGNLLIVCTEKPLGQVTSLVVRQATGCAWSVHTRLSGPNVGWCVKGDHIDVNFQEVQQFLKFSLAATAVSKNLHLISVSLGRSGLYVVQVHPLLLRNRVKNCSVQILRWNWINSTSGYHFKFSSIILCVFTILY